MIKWCKKVPQKLISNFYKQCSMGIFDDDLADELGYALFERCKSIISVTDAFEKKRLQCPYCEQDIPLVDNIFNCSCGVKFTWDEFRTSYKGKQLYAANALPIFFDYIKNFTKAKSFIEKLIAIDILLHSFHIKNSYQKNLDNYDVTDDNVELNRPAAANLIEGSLSEVIIFLDNLTENGINSQCKNQWREQMKRANGNYALFIE